MTMKRCEKSPSAFSSNLVRCTRGSSVTVKPENPLNHSDANDNP